MSSTSRRQGSRAKAGNFTKGTKTMHNAKTRFIALFTVLLLTTVLGISTFAVAASENTETSANTNTTVKAGFLATTFNDFLGFIGLGSTAPESAPQPAAAIAADNGCDNLPAGLVACYRGDLDASDVTGVHNGEWVGVYSYATGKVGAGSFSFNGKNKVEVPNAADLNPTNVTVDGWVNLSDTDGSFGLVSKGGAYALGVRDGHVTFTSRNTEGVIETIESPSTIKSGTWVHIAATHDGAARRIYIDGVEVIEGDQNGLFGADAGNLAIGSIEKRKGGYSAQADEVKLFNRALSADEIAKIAANKPNGPANVTSITASQNPVLESGGAIFITVNRDATSNGAALSVNFTATPTGTSPATGGAACTIGVDYVFGTPSVNYNAGESGPKSVTLTICQDSLVEGDETFNVNATFFGGGVGETFSGSPVLITITDDDKLALSSSAPVNEGTPGANGTITYTFDRGLGAGATAPAFSVPFTMTGTAQFSPSVANVSAQDYTLAAGTCNGPFAFNTGTGVGTASFGANSPAQTCTVILTTIADDFVENNETAIMTVAAPIGNPSVATGLINNDDLPFMITDISAGFTDGAGNRYAEEGSTGVLTSTLTYRVTRALCSTGTPANPGGAGTGLCDGGDTTALAAGQTVAFAMTGVAGNTTDYNLSQATPLTFGAGSTSQTTVLTPIVDIIVENDEDATFTAAANAASYRQGTAAVTGFINDDDEDVRVTLGAPTSVPENGPGVLTYTVTRNKLSVGLVAGGNNPIDPTADPLLVNFSFTPAVATPTTNTCSDTSDFTVSGAGVTYVPSGTCTGTIAFAAGITTGTIIVTPTNDNVPENDKTVTLNITPNTGAATNAYGVGNQTALGAGANASATGTITNDDFQVIVQVSPSSVLEDATPTANQLVYTFTRIGQMSAASNLCANFNASGTATATGAGQDYTTSFGQNLNTCVNPIGGAIGPYFNANVGTSFGGLAIAGGQGASPLINGVQTNTNTFNVSSIADANVEPDETVIVQVDNPGVGNTSLYAPGNPGQATGTIVNDDAIVSIAVSPTAVREDGAPNLIYTFTRSANFGPALTVNYTVNNPVPTNPACGNNLATPVLNGCDANGVDYLASAGQAGTFTFATTTTSGTGSGTVTFAAGSPTATVIVDPNVDSFVEPDENVQITVTPSLTAPVNYTNATGAGGTATGQITNDDSLVSVAVSGSPASEGNVAPAASAPTALTYTFTRNGNITAGLSVNYTIAGGANPVLQNDITGAFVGVTNVVGFAAGSATATVTITPVADNTVEPDETVRVTLQPGTGYTPDPTNADGVIRNDDNNVVCTGGASVNEGNTGAGNTITFTCTRTTDGAQAGVNLSVPYALSGTATNGTDYSIAPASPLVFTGVAGQNTQTATIVVTTIPDTTVEPDETVILDFASGLAAGGNGFYLNPNGTTLTGTILNDDQSVTVLVTSPVGKAVLEGNVPPNTPNSLIYTFTRNTAGALANTPVTVNFQASGTATFASGAGQDYTVLTPAGTTFVTTSGVGSVVIPAGAVLPGANPVNQSSTVTVNTVPDNNIELDETVIFTVTAGAYSGSGSTDTGTITNDDTTFTIDFTGFTNSRTENADNTNASPFNTGTPPRGSVATFVVTRNGSTANTQTVDVSTIPTGTAGSGTATSGQINSNCGSPINLANNTDYITDGKTLTFSSTDPAQQSQTFIVLVCGDGTFEQNETIVTQLTNPKTNGVSFPNNIVGSPGQATYTILNDDLGPVLSLATNGALNAGPITQEGAAGVPNGGVNILRFVVNSTPTSGLDTTFEFETADFGANPANSPSDYTGTQASCPVGSIRVTATTRCATRVPAGASSVNIDIPVIDDAIFETTETLTLTISNPVATVPILPAGFGPAAATNGIQPTIAANTATTPNPQVGTILDNEAAPTYSINDVTQNEGNGGDLATTFNFSITRSGPSAQANQTVCYKTQDGNADVPGGGINQATGGVTASGTFDYTIINDTTNVNCVLFTNGPPSVFNAPVVVNGDLIFEQNETFSVVLSTINGVIPPAFGSATFTASTFSDPNGLGTIINDDGRPGYQVTAVTNNLSALEGTVSPQTFPLSTVGANTITFGITRSGPTQAASKVTFTVADATSGNIAKGGTSCTAGTDYVFPTFNAASGATDAVNDTATSRFFPNNAADPFTRNVTVALCPDASKENNENFTLTLNSADDGGLLGTPGVATIIDDDSAPIFTLLQADDPSVLEGPLGNNNARLNFNIRRVGTTQFSSTVCYNTVDGSAVSGAQPTAVPTLTPPEGDFIALTTGPVNCVVFAPNDVGTPVDSMIVPVTVYGDNKYEINEQMTFQLLSATNGSISIADNARFVATGTILNDDATPAFSLGNVTQVEGTAANNAPANFFFRLTRTGATQLDTTLTFASSSTTNASGNATLGTDCSVAGTDYITVGNTTTNNPLVNGALTFPAAGFSTAGGPPASGPNFIDIPVQVCQDSVAETSETFALNITSAGTYGQIVPAIAGGGGATAFATIVDDDSFGFTIRNPGPSAFEGNSGTTPFTFTIDRTGNPTPASTVCYNTVDGTAVGTANGGVDYVSLPNTSCQTFATGVISLPVVVLVNGDTTFEPDETFFLHLFSASNLGTIPPGTTGDRVATIINDDTNTAPIALEGDINRPVGALNTPGVGDGVVDGIDVAQYNTLLLNQATLSTGFQGSEFQRMDTADVATFGNGCLQPADKQQIRNYSVGGPLTWVPAAGPTAQTCAGRPEIAALAKTVADTPVIHDTDASAAARELKVISVTGAQGNTVVVAVSLESQGNEVITKFSLNFDTSRLTYEGPTTTGTTSFAVAGSGAPGGTVTVNGSQAASGNLGVGVDSNSVFQTGTREIVRITFRVNPAAPFGAAFVNFGDTPTTRQVVLSDFTTPVPTYTNGTVTVGQPRIIRFNSTTGPITPGFTTATIDLVALGGETAAQFSILFDPTKFTVDPTNVNTGIGTNPDIALGTGVPAGCNNYTVSAAGAPQGRIGFNIDCNGFSFAAGTDQLIRVRLRNIGAAAGSVNLVSVTNTPFSTSLTDAAASNLGVSGQNGNVTILGPTAAGVSISGRVMSANGQGLRNASVVITDSDGVRRTVTTSSFGFYQFDDVAAGGTYVLGVSAKRYRFASRIIQVSDSLADVNFTGQE